MGLREMTVRDAVIREMTRRHIKWCAGIMLSDGTKIWDSFERVLDEDIAGREVICLISLAAFGTGYWTGRIVRVDSPTLEITNE